MNKKIYNEDLEYPWKLRNVYSVIISYDIDII